VKIDELKYQNNSWVVNSQQIDDAAAATIVFIFGDSDIIKLQDSFASLQTLYPNAHIIGSSSSGNVLGPTISDAAIVGLAVQMEHSRVEISIADFDGADDVNRKSTGMIAGLPAAGLKHVFVLSEGLLNGSELVSGLNAHDTSLSVSGGMAGDADRFAETWIVADEPARRNRAVAVGFYGDNLSVSTSVHGGWTSFGVDRLVTRSRDNVLYELDGQPALDLYKEYLGVFAEELPASGMRFPLNIRASGDTHEVIRTLLSIDETEKSITFAGDIPQGYLARLMKPDLDVLYDGTEAINAGIRKINDKTALGLVVSCVGRRVVMQDMVEEELEIIQDVLGDSIHLTGFYSYGEIAPFSDELLQCHLHNQTMTLTAIYET
jgi:hypothetical protein